MSFGDLLQFIHANSNNAHSRFCILKLRVPLMQISHAEITAEEGFLLSCIDGSWDVRSILSRMANAHPLFRTGSL